MVQKNFDIRILNPEAPLDDFGRAKVEALAKRQHDANSAIMKLLTNLGGSFERGIDQLPNSAKAALNSAAEQALTKCYDLGSYSSRTDLLPRGSTASLAMGVLTGAAGGAGGIATTIAELPFTTALIFRAVQDVAEEHGADRNDPQTRAECLVVFGEGSQAEDDDGVNTGFFGARFAVSGLSANTIISTIAPRFAATISQKLAAQAVPILGALAGAGSNYIFIRYYTELAHVHFGLKAIAEDYDAEQVYDAFHAALAR